MKTEWQKLTTEGKIEAIQWAYKNGHSASSRDLANALSVEYDCTVSRNAIIGIVNRWGSKMPEVSLNGAFPENFRAKVKREKERKVVSDVPKAPRVKKAPKPAKIATPKPEPVVKAVHTPKKPKMLYELNNGQCKYPISGSGFSMLFCADATEPNKSWCPACSQIVFYRKAA